MTSFIALYRGDGTSRPQIIAVSSDTDLVADAAKRMLAEEVEKPKIADPALNALRQGRREAISAIATQNAEAGNDECLTNAETKSLQTIEEAQSHV